MLFNEYKNEIKIFQPGCFANGHPDLGNYLGKSFCLGFIGGGYPENLDIMTQYHLGFIIF